MAEQKLTEPRLSNLSQPAVDHPPLAVVYTWVFLAVFAASVEPIIVKLGYRGAVTPLQLLVIKNLFAAVAILPLTRKFVWLGSKSALEILSVSLLLLANNACVLMALQSLTAVSLITIITTTPALVGIVNQKLGRDILGSKFWLGFLLCFSGVVISLEPASMAFDAIGVVFALLAVATSTMYRVRMEDMTAKYTPPVVSTYVFLLNGLFTLMFLLPFVGAIPQPSLMMGGALGVAAAVANFAFLYALNLVGSTKISIVNMVQRPLVIIIAALMLKEPLGILQVAGIVMVLAGIQIASVKRVKKQV